MAGWQVRGQGGGFTPPIGLRVAGTGPRMGGWFLDLVVFALLSLIPLGLAIASGAVGANPEALQQTANNPYVQPSVPWLVINANQLVVWAAVWVLIGILYATAFWSLLGSLPGQRLMGMRVVDAATGKPLVPWRALWRSILVYGIPAVAAAVLFVVTCQVLAAIVPADFGLSSETTYIDATYNNALGVLISICDVAVWAWPLMLLISTAVSRDRRGIHDRLSRSLVLGRAAVVQGWYPYGQMPAGPYYGYPSPGQTAGAEFGGGAGPRFSQPPGYTPWPGYLYGPPPGAPDGPPPGGLGQPLGAPGQPWVWPYPWPPVPVTDPQPDVEAAPQTEQPAETPGAETPRTETPLTPPSIAAAAGGLKGTDRRPVDESPQVFGAKLPAGLKVARINRRVTAYLLDSLIVLVVFGVVSAGVFGSPDPNNATLAPERLAMLAGLIAGVAQAVLFVVSWSLWRGSIGQKAVGLQVGEESTGSRLGLIDALVRWAVLQGPLALYLAVPYVLRPALGVLVIGWSWLLMYSARHDPDGRGYHDRIAHSLVVEQSSDS